MGNIKGGQTKPGRKVEKGNQGAVDGALNDLGSSRRNSLAKPLRRG